MKYSVSLLFIFLITLGCRADVLRTGYYPAYAAANMPPSEIDFSAMTQIIHFSLFPNGDGSLNSTQNVMSYQNITNLVTLAHNAHVKALVCIGGENSYFPNAASAGSVNFFIYNLTNFMATNDYDGIDVDWEPLDDGDANVYTNFIIGLRTALNEFNPPRLLTTAIPPSADPALVATVENCFDQINLMTYDLSGPYEGWVTWFNSPIYSGGYTFPSNAGELVPSVEGMVTNFEAAGIPTNKLAIGITFYGYVWGSGNDGSGNAMSYPRESWETAPTNFFTVTYNQIISSNFPAADFNYDTVAQAPWIGLGNEGTNDLFISYENARSCEAKVSYARNNGLGGVFIWELSQDHVSGQSQSDPLLEAVKQAAATPGSLTAQHSGKNINLSFNSAPLGNYSVQWSTNLTKPWNTLVSTNVGLTGTGDVIQIQDPANQPLRFYRVQSPL
jgi:chitinase